MLDDRVVLRLASAKKNLPGFHDSFVKIYMINPIHFWEHPVACLRGLRKLLKSGGLIAVTLQPRSRNDTDAATNEVGKEVLRNLERAGFSRVRLEILHAKPVAVACALVTG
jgi:hypothetical protein